MAGYILRRIAQIVPALLLISILVFALQTASRIDPAHEIVARQNGGFAPPAAIAAKRHELGLDRPLPVQYARWLGGIARFDFGRSYSDGTPVSALLRQRLPATILLAVAALALTLVVSLPLGVAAALWRRVRLFDVAVRVLSVLGASIPGFALALGLIWLFAARLHWLPAFGGPSLRQLVLPAVALSVPQTGLLVRLTRAEVLDVLGSEFVVVAQAKGLPRRTVALRHLLPNALVPVLTVAGLMVANLLAGAFIIEFVFAWNGLGRLAVAAVQNGDMPVVLAYVLFVAATFLLVNLLVDVLYAVVDPRLRVKAPWQ
jgi:ABC-type dipeptide/oligopeptide/nickel transport system permease component